jgi:hypothetical protein
MDAGAPAPSPDASQDGAIASEGSPDNEDGAGTGSGGSGVYDGSTPSEGDDSSTLGAPGDNSMATPAPSRSRRSSSSSTSSSSSSSAVSHGDSSAHALVPLGEYSQRGLRRDMGIVARGRCAVLREAVYSPETRTVC